MVHIPPLGAEGDQIDSDRITARQEDGILIINVPRVEPELVNCKTVEIK